jgi:serine/threonine protein kinase
MGTNCSMCFAGHSKLKMEDLRDRDSSNNTSMQTTKYQGA